MHEGNRQVAQEAERLAAREAVEVPWDELREARNLKEVLAARERERRSDDAAAKPETRGRAVWFARVGAGGLVALALVVGALASRDPNVEEPALVAHEVGESASLAPTTGSPSPELDTADTSVLTLPDGGHVRLQAGAQLELLEERIVQRSGRVRYTLDREHTRPLEIELGQVVLRVGAAVFEATIDLHNVELIIFEGRVELREDGRWVVLERGSEAHIPREPLSSAELETADGARHSKRG